MAHKVKHKLVVFGSLAIMSIYAAGYTHTEQAAEQLAAGEQSASIIADTPTPQPTTGSIPPVTVPNTPFVRPQRNRFAPTLPTPTPATPSQTAQQSTAYKDGTYSGLGTSRYGNIEVSVTVQNNKIVDVKITRCTTSYPERLIDGLPAEVVSSQNPQVDFVSGATYSSRAFETAVQQALQQAQKA